MAGEFEVGVEITPEGGSVKRFETEVKAVAKRIEPIIQKAFTLDSAAAKKALAPFEAQAKKLARNISVLVKVDVDKKSIASSQAAIQKAFNKSPILQKVQTQVDAKQSSGSLRGLRADINSISSSVTGQLTPALAQGSRSLKELGINAVQSSTSIRGLLTTILGAAGAAGAAGALVNLGSTALRQATLVDTQTRGLTNLEEVLGASAAEATRRIQEEANKLPGTFGDVQNAVVQLGSTLKLNLEDSIETFETLVGAALASGKGIDAANRSITQLAQISGKGKLQLEELTIVAENIPGISVAKVIEEIGKSMGVTTDQARSLISQGLVPSSVGIQAILTVAKQVPGANQAIANSADSLEAVLSTLSDTINRGLANAFLEAIKSSGTFQKDLGQLATNLGPLFKGLIPLFASALRIFNQLLPSISALAQTFAKLTPAIEIAARLTAVLVKPLELLLQVVNFLAPALTVLLARFLIMKTVSGVFGGLQTAIQLATRQITASQAATQTLANVFPRLSGAVNLAAGSYRNLTAAMTQQTGAAKLNEVANNSAAGAAARKTAADAFSSARGTPLGTVTDVAAGGSLLSKFAAKFPKLGTLVGKGTGALTAFGTKLAGVARFLPGIGTLLTAATTAWNIYSNAVNNAKVKSQEFLTEAVKDIPSTDLEARAKAYGKVADEAFRAAKNESLLERGTQLLNPFDENTGIEQTRLSKDARKAQEDAQRRIFVRDTVVDQVSRKTGEDAQEIVERALAEGIDFSTIELDLQNPDFMPKLINQLLNPAEVTTIAKDRAKESAEAFLTEFNKNFSQAESIIGAQKAVQSAEQSLNSVTQEGNKLRRERAELLKKEQELLRDTARDERELAEANRDVTRATRALNALLKEQANIPDDIADLNDDKTLASLALAQATRAEEEALRKLNGETEKAEKLKKKTKGISVNLAGLSLPEIKAALANARLAATERQEADEEAEEQAVDRVELEEDYAEKVIATRKAKDQVAASEEAIQAAQERSVTIIDDIAEAEERRLDAVRERDKIAAGDTQRARELKEIQGEIKGVDDQITQNARDRKAAEEGVNDAKREQRKINAELIGDERTLTQLFLERLAAINDPAIRKQTFLRSLPGLLATAAVDVQTGQKKELSPDIIQAIEAQAALVPDNATLDQLRKFIRKLLLEGFNVVIPGLRHGGIVSRFGDIISGYASGGLVGTDKSLKGGQLIVAGEGGKEELILPLRGSKNRAVQLMAAAAKVSNPEIALMLRRAIGAQGFKTGGIVGRSSGGFAQGGVIKPSTDVPQPFIDLSDQVGVVDDNVIEGFESQDAIIKALQKTVRLLSTGLATQAKLILGLQTALEAQGTLITGLRVGLANLRTSFTIIETGFVALKTGFDTLRTKTLPEELERIRTDLQGQINLLVDEIKRVKDIASGVSSEASGLIRDLTGKFDSLRGSLTGIKTVADNLNNTLTGIFSRPASTTGTTTTTTVLDNTFQNWVLQEWLPFKNEDNNRHNLYVDYFKKIGRGLGKISGSAGFASGGVITGTPGSFGQLIRVGEYNRPESVVPLTNKENMLSVLQRSIPYATPAVRGVLEKALQQDEGRSANVSIDLSRNHSVGLTPAASKKDQMEFANTVGNVIANKLIAAGVGGDSGPITVVLEGSDYNELNAKKLVREIERKRNRF